MERGIVMKQVKSMLIMGIVGLFSVGTISYAEEVMTSQTEESSILVEPNKTITLKELLDDLFNRNLITKEVKEEYIKRLDAAVSEEETIALGQEIARLEMIENQANPDLEKKKEETNQKIQELIDSKKLQSEFGADFIKRVDNSASVEEIDQIYLEVEKQVQLNEDLGHWAWAEHYINTKIVIEDHMKTGKLTQEQGQEFIARLEKTTKSDEIFEIQKDINKQIDENQGLAEKFNEVAESIKKEIKQLVEEGRITKEEGDKLIAKLETLTTTEELDKLQMEVDAYKNKSIDPINKKGDDPKVNKLPQTGEQNTPLFTAIGVVVLGGLIAIIIAKKKTRKNHVDN